MGTRKLYEVLYAFLLEHNIKIARDALFELLGEQGLLVKRYKRRISTTTYNRTIQWSKQKLGRALLFLPHSPEMGFRVSSGDTLFA